MPPGRYKARTATASVLFGATWHKLQSNLQLAAIVLGLEVRKQVPVVN